MDIPASFTESADFDVQLLHIVTDESSLDPHKNRKYARYALQYIRYVLQRATSSEI